MHQAALRKLGWKPFFQRQLRPQEIIIVVVSQSTPRRARLTQSQTMLRLRHILCGGRCTESNS